MFPPYPPPDEVWNLSAWNSWTQYRPDISCVQVFELSFRFLQNISKSSALPQLGLESPGQKFLLHALKTQSVPVHVDFLLHFIKEFIRFNRFAVASLLR